MTLEMRFTAQGPIIDGSAAKVIDDVLDKTENEAAQIAHDKVQARLRQVLRHPTGHYQSRITVDRRSDSPVVTDGGVVYGPWLEGVGSRNHTTRFKGYHTFRTIAQEMQADVVHIAENELEHQRGRLE